MSSVNSNENAIATNPVLPGATRGWHPDQHLGPGSRVKYHARNHNVDTGLVLTLLEAIEAENPFVIEGIPVSEEGWADCRYGWLRVLGRRARGLSYREPLLNLLHPEVNLKVGCSILSQELFLYDRDWRKAVLSMQGEERGPAIVAGMEILQLRWKLFF